MAGTKISGLSTATSVLEGDTIPIVSGGNNYGATAGLIKAVGTARNTADVTNATTTLANLSDLTLTLTAGKTYTGRLVLKCTNSTAADGIQLDFNGGTATMTNFWAGGGIVASGGTDTVGTNISTSLSGVINFTVLTGETIIIIEISMVVNAGGTFIPRQAENTHSTGTLTTRLGSYLWLNLTSN